MYQLKRFDIINELIKKNRFRSYLELGVDNKECFNRIVCREKFSVDINPLTKADYVGSTHDFFIQNDKEFDIIFVDASHEWEDAFLDIVDSLAVVKDGGYVLAHDCNPHKEIITRVPRETLEWTGNVYKACARLMSTHGISGNTVDTDYGVAIFKNDPVRVYDRMVDVDDLTYEQFDKNRKELINLISVKKFKELYL